VLLSELLAADRVRVPLRSQTKDDLLRELVELATAGREGVAVDAILESVRQREQVLSTGIGGGIAIPHGKTSQIDQLVMAAGVCGSPVEFDALDGQPVELLFLLVGPESAAGAHVKALSRISRLLRRDALRDGLRTVRTGDEFLQLIRESEAN
jgi:mannitol/fructose-specific phosphotransferase system IIA component (Ntr-type)